MCEFSQSKAVPLPPFSLRVIGDHALDSCHAPCSSRSFSFLALDIFFFWMTCHDNFVQKTLPLTASVDCVELKPVKNEHLWGFLTQIHPSFNFIGFTGNDVTETQTFLPSFWTSTSCLLILSHHHGDLPLETPNFLSQPHNPKLLTCQLVHWSVQFFPQNNEPKYTTLSSFPCLNTLQRSHITDTQTGTRRDV